MNLRELEYVIAVGNEMHFGRAAKQCGVSQATLSGQIKRLEDEIGVKVFERSRRHVVVTEVGKSIIAAAKRMQHEAQFIKETAAASSDPFSGTYCIGAIPTLASYLFPKIGPSFAKLYPKIKLVFVEEKTERLRALLQEGRLDAAFVASPLDSDNFNTRHLFNDRLFVAMSASHELAGEDSVSAAMLDRHKLLLLEEGHCLREQAIKLCELNGISIDREIEATSLETLRVMVESGSGITIIPEIAIDRSLSSLSYVPFDGQSDFREISLIRRNSCARVAVFESLVSHFESRMRVGDFSQDSKLCEFPMTLAGSNVRREARAAS